MRLLYTDETNTDPTSTEFFVYGGICVSEEHATAISNEIDAIRKSFNYQPLDILKFNTRERPSQISADDHREIKMKVMETAVKNEVKLFSSFILHNIATSPEPVRLNEINTICYHFDCYLGQVNDSGLVLIDPFQDSNLRKHLCEKFSIGISGLPYT